MPRLPGVRDMPTCLACCPPSQPSSAVESLLGTALTGRRSRKHRVPTSFSSHRLSGACVLGSRGARGSLWTLASTSPQLPLSAPCPQHPLLPGQALPPLGPRPVQWVHPSQLRNLHPEVLPRPLTGRGLLAPCCQPRGAQKPLPLQSPDEKLRGSERTQTCSGPQTSG